MKLWLDLHHFHALEWELFENEVAEPLCVALYLVWTKSITKTSTLCHRMTHVPCGEANNNSTATTCGYQLIHHRKWWKWHCTTQRLKIKSLHNIHKPLPSNTWARLGKTTNLKIYYTSFSVALRLQCSHAKGILIYSLALHRFHLWVHYKIGYHQKNAKFLGFKPERSLWQIFSLESLIVSRRGIYLDFATSITFISL